MDSHAGPQFSKEVLFGSAIDDFADPEILAGGVLSVKKSGGDEYLIRNSYCSAINE
jgi:hypothetical protein